MQHLPSDSAQRQHDPQNLALIYLVENPHLHPVTNKEYCNDNSTSNQAIQQTEI
jgi:hypothetical protein